MNSWPIRDATSTIYPLYSRANVGEIFPDPISPLTEPAMPAGVHRPQHGS